MKTQNGLKLGLDGLTPTDLVEKGRNHLDSCTDNDNVTLAPDFLEKLATACDNLEAANIAVRENGGRQDTMRRTARVKDLQLVIRNLAGYVNAQCADDGEKISSTGFDLRKTPQPTGVLDAAKNVRAERGKLPGDLVVRWNGVPGRLSYSLFINAGDPNNPAEWKWLKTTSRNSFMATGLVSDQQYYFRVRATGTAGKGKMSDVATSKAA